MRKAQAPSRPSSQNIPAAGIKIFKMKAILYPFFFVLILSLASCDPDRVFEKNQDIENTSWKKEDTVSFEFEIPDSTLSYNLYYTVRYNNTYPKYNLFTRYFLYDSSHHLLKTPKLPEDMYLFDIKTGRPYGKGLGDVFDQKISFLKDYRFPYQGKYQLKVVQYMRDPISGILSFGLRVEKSAAEKQ